VADENVVAGAELRYHLPLSFRRVNR